MTVQLDLVKLAHPVSSIAQEVPVFKAEAGKLFLHFPPRLWVLPLLLWPIGSHSPCSTHTQLMGVGRRRILVGGATQGPGCFPTMTPFCPPVSSLPWQKTMTALFITAPCVSRLLGGKHIEQGWHQALVPPRALAPGLYSCLVFAGPAWDSASATASPTPSLSLQSPWCTVTPACLHSPCGKL